MSSTKRSNAQRSEKIQTVLTMRLVRETSTEDLNGIASWKRMSNIASCRNSHLSRAFLIQFYKHSIRTHTLMIIDKQQHFMTMTTTTIAREVERAREERRKKPALRSSESSARISRAPSFAYTKSLVDIYASDILFIISL
jgi:hypothetical protein